MAAPVRHITSEIISDALRGLSFDRTSTTIHVIGTEDT
jgi:hypothetical protein